MQKAKSSLREFEVRYNNVLEQAREGVGIFKDEFSQFSQNVSFSELQSECVTDIVQDLGDRMDILFQAGGGMNKSYIELMEMLDTESASIN